MATAPTSATIRTYHVGFGDCFLISFEYGRKSERHVLIDFGSTGVPKGVPKSRMMDIAANIKQRTGGKLHAVVATRGLGLDDDFRLLNVAVHAALQAHHRGAEHDATRGAQARGEHAGVGLNTLLGCMEPVDPLLVRPSVRILGRVLHHRQTTGCRRPCPVCIPRGGRVSGTETAPVHHPVVVEHQQHRASDAQLRVADAITKFAGSMTFVYVHIVLFIGWMLFVEKNPWPTLTLTVSLEAIFLSTFVMIGQNRSADFAKRKADHDFVEQEQELKLNTDLTRAIHELAKEIHATVVKPSS